MLLKDMPAGALCFIDATIFYYHIVNSPPLSDDCSDFLARVEQGQIAGVTSGAVLAEATHKVMLAEIVARHGVERKGLVARLKRHSELLDGLTEHKKVAATAHSLGLAVEPVTFALLARAADLSTQLRLLTNDALTVALMEQLGVTNMATNDDDFDAVSACKVFKPTRA